MQEIKKKDAIKVMRRFDKNLNVTNKNIPFSHCLRDNLACVPGVPKGRKRRFSVREKREGRARNEEGERVPLLATPSLARGLALTFPSPAAFRTFATYARDYQVILSSYSSS